MQQIPAVVRKRLQKALPKFAEILRSAKRRDVNEANTVTIITDVLEEVFGFDRYSEITREQATGTGYCDLAVTIHGSIQYLIEVKPVGVSLNIKHVRQAVTYAAEKGITYVVLTNGIDWNLYKVVLAGKIEKELILNFDLLNLNPKKDENLQTLFMLCKRGMANKSIDDYYEHQRIVNPHVLAALLLKEPLLKMLATELRRLKDGMRLPSTDELANLLKQSVLKRELLDGEGAEVANKIVKVKRRRLRKEKKETKIIEPDVKPRQLVRILP